MSSLPQRHSLVNQTIAFLEGQIATDRWRDWLPAERTLAEMLQVSRSTLRRALKQMRRNGAIEATHGTGNRIRSRAAASSGRLHSVDVALLTPEPLERLSPNQTLWIDELRAMLSERGCHLHVIHGRQYARRDPSAALEKLVRHHPHACWILAKASVGCQRWFADRGLPCIVAGSCHVGVDLPYRDVDYRATCRHAAGILLGLGHRRLAFISQRTQFAGDIESETGFVETVRGSGHSEAIAVVCHHDATVTGMVHLLKRLTEQKPAPTALLVTNAYHALTIMSGLARIEWRVPTEVSVISRDEDPFLPFLVPSPARYVTRPQLYARSLLQPVLDLLEGRAVTQRAALLMPEFVRGETVAPAAGFR
jgi:DNA-binding LacI/PurR family transcriptional regulator